MRNHMCSSLSLLLLVYLGLLNDPLASAEKEIHALDGWGHPVTWWAVLKFPQHARVTRFTTSTDRESTLEATPCDCPPPDCTNVPTATLNSTAQRATGLCYLYADANRPYFQHFRTLGYDCLGQGGNDPLSHTLRQIQQTKEEEKVYWAYFNDQFNGIARNYHSSPSSTPSKMAHDICSGRDLFSAHAKGGLAFHREMGGFYLQTSTPNYPDPTVGTTTGNRNDTFVRLGCQLDNNVQFAQHMLAMSLDMLQLNTLGEQLQTARLCSSNFYKEELHDLLTSTNFYQDGKQPEKNANFSALYHALLDPDLPVRNQSSAFPIKLKTQFSLPRSISAETATDGQKSRVFKPIKEHTSLLKFASADTKEIEREHIVEGASRLPVTASTEEHVLGLVKSPLAAVPPWALLAEVLESDVSVATWWDGNYGIPNICAGDFYGKSPHKFCLDNRANRVHLTANDTARYNVENLIEARWTLSDQNLNLTWHLVGGREPDGNHAKWGLSTPRSGHINASNAYVTFADLNMEGFPCSKSCNGSQAGRGGSFFSLMQPLLHRSLAQGIVSQACRCASPMHFPLTMDSSMDEFKRLRMCHHGCGKKLEKYFEALQLPQMSSNASSFWHNP